MEAIRTVRSDWRTRAYGVGSTPLYQSEAVEERDRARGAQGAHGDRGARRGDRLKTGGRS
jgi:hypothetical protein